MFLIPFFFIKILAFRSEILYDSAFSQFYDAKQMYLLFFSYLCPQVLPTRRKRHFTPSEEKSLSAGWQCDFRGINQ